jgi:hypothetical protein
MKQPVSAHWTGIVGGPDVPTVLPSQRIGARFQNLCGTRTSRTAHVVGYASALNAPSRREVAAPTTREASGAAGPRGSRRETAKRRTPMFTRHALRPPGNPVQNFPQARLRQTTGRSLTLWCLGG